MNKIKEETMPDDIILDLARTVEILADSHNCDDGSLKLRGLDWAYLHKLNRRSKHWLNKVYNLDESEVVNETTYVECVECGDRFNKFQGILEERTCMTCILKREDPDAIRPSMLTKERKQKIEII